MSLLDEVLARATEIRAIGRKYDVANPRVFGSVGRREERPDSDIDFLVDPGPECGHLSLGGMAADLEELLGRRVDVRTLKDLHPKMRRRVLAEAVSLDLEGFLEGLNVEGLDVAREPDHGRDDIFDDIHRSAAAKANAGPDAARSQDFLSGDDGSPE